MLGQIVELKVPDLSANRATLPSDRAGGLGEGDSPCPFENLSHNLFLNNYFFISPGWGSTGYLPRFFLPWWPARISPRVFCLWHVLHSVCRLSRLWPPPLATFLMWSTSRRSVLPHFTHWWWSRWRAALRCLWGAPPDGFSHIVPLPHFVPCSDHESAACASGVAWNFQCLIDGFRLRWRQG